MSIFSFINIINMQIQKGYRVIFQTYDQSNSKESLNEVCVLESTLEAPTNCLNFSIGMKNQIKLIQEVQNNVLNEKVKILEHGKAGVCPNCPGKLVKGGKQTTTFHDVFTDHRVAFQRFKCKKCNYETTCTVRQLLGTIQSGELQKIQSELGATHTYRESERLLDMFSGGERYINNHDRIKQVSESVGNALSKITQAEKEIVAVAEVKELVLNIDGGHIKTTEDGLRSIEAMTSVIYQPEAIKSNKKDTYNHIESKNCSASICDDNQEQMICSTIVAALKQGLGKSTHVTALCDGAANCWNVAEAIRPLCGSMTSILDWFHVAMKIENISLPEQLKEKLLNVKWHLWRGKIDEALDRLTQLVTLAKDEKHIDRINKLYNYITNNSAKIVNYEERQKAGLVFTSNLAESTVESLINRRCKGRQHMRWSREGLNPLLQIRAALHSQGEWSNKWQSAVLNAA
jgi:hypothetical protein